MRPARMSSPATRPVARAVVAPALLLFVRASDAARMASPPSEVPGRHTHMQSGHRVRSTRAALRWRRATRCRTAANSLFGRELAGNQERRYRSRATATLVTDLSVGCRETRASDGPFPVPGRDRAFPAL